MAAIQQDLVYQDSTSLIISPCLGCSEGEVIKGRGVDQIGTSRGGNMAEIKIPPCGNKLRESERATFLIYRSSDER